MEGVGILSKHLLYFVFLHSDCKGYHNSFTLTLSLVTGKTSRRQGGRPVFSVNKQHMVPINDCYIGHFYHWYPHHHVVFAPRTLTDENKSTLPPQGIIHYHM